MGRNVLQNRQYGYYAKIQNLCYKNHLTCTNISINSDGTAIVIINGNEEVTLSLQKDLSSQVSSLQLTLYHLTIEGKRLSRIDFRFDKPVISY